MNRLSKRLEAIIAMTPDTKGGTVADVGTDHGFVPIRLVQEGKAKRAIAMDVRPGPLARAREHILALGLEDRVEARLCDGLSGLMPGEADAAVLAGMGGELMLRILREGGQVRESLGFLILSPQSEPAVFRRGLEELGLAIRRERMVEEGGKFYTVMLADKGAMHYENNYEYRYGRCLIEERSPVLKQYLEKEKGTLLAVLSALERAGARAGEGAAARKCEVLQELNELYEACGRVGWKI